MNGSRSSDVEWGFLGKENLNGRPHRKRVNPRCQNPARHGSDGLNWTEELKRLVPTGQWDMPLQPGTSLGRYAVTAEIGEGGMGEVYDAIEDHAS